MTSKLEQALALLAEMRDELANRSDVEDGSDGPCANDAMQLEMLGGDGFTTDGWADRVARLLR